jgi:hypothetical protein
MGRNGQTDEESRREAARLLGRVRTAKKAESSRRNAVLGGRPVKPLADIECNCGPGETGSHKSKCLRGQAIKRRLARGLSSD